MRLVFDTSALITITRTGKSGAVRQALKARSATVLVPASVVFEVGRQKEVGVAAATPGAPLGAPTPGPLGWVYDGWMSEDLGGEVISFDKNHADVLVSWLTRPPKGADWYGRAKLLKAFDDACPVFWKMLDQVTDPEPSIVSGPHGLANLKHRLGPSGRNFILALDTTKRSTPRASATIDWLHLGTALGEGARLVADDGGAEFPAEHTWTTEQLLRELDLAGSY